MGMAQEQEAGEGTHAGQGDGIEQAVLQCGGAQCIHWKEEIPPGC